MAVKVHLFECSYDTKPSKAEIGYISCNITNCISEIEIEDFAQAVGENGRPFTPAIFNGSRKNENFISQQVYALDFDGGMTIQEFVERAKKYDVTPSFIYETYSSTKNNQRFRVVFKNDCVIDNIKASLILGALLLQLFPEADQCCKDPARMFFGGKKLLYCDKDAEINIKDIAVSMQLFLMDKTLSNYTRTIKNFAYGLGIKCEKSLLGIHRMEDIYPSDENRIFTSKDNILMVNIQNSSKGYVIELDTPQHPDSMRSKATPQIVQNMGCQELMKICPLLKDFYKEGIPHQLKFLLATNLIYIKGGKTIFFDGLTKNKEKWKIEWKYIRVNQYCPQRCDNGNCPYLKSCQCKTMLEKANRKIYRVRKEEEYISLDQASAQLQNSLQEAIRRVDNGIHLIKAQTAMGKTTAYCNLAKRDPKEKQLMIVVPTIKLQLEVEKELLLRGIPVYTTVSVKFLLKGTELEGTIESLYSKGFGYKVKKVIKKYLKEKKDTLSEIQKEHLSKCLNNLKYLDGKTCVVTTHAMFLRLPKEILSQYEIIIDEDILMTIFKNTASISFKDLEEVIEKGILPEALECRICEILNMQDGTVGTTNLSHLHESRLDELYDEIITLEGALPDLLSSDTFHVNTEEKKIDYFSALLLPDVKITVVSATLNEKLYRDFCHKKNISFLEIEEVKYTGKLKQYTAHSVSRRFVQETGMDVIYKGVYKKTKNTDIQTITFKSIDKNKEIYFGKTEGFNEYKGKDVAVIGTPHYAPFIYKLIGKYLGYNVDGELSVRRVENNGYSFPIMTFYNLEMRNLQFFFLASELEQAIGRARLLRFDCTVYLFSNFPCKQAEIIQDDYLDTEG